MSSTVMVAGSRTRRRSSATSAAAGAFVALLALSAPSGAIAADPAEFAHRLPGRRIEVRAGTGTVRTAPILALDEAGTRTGIAGVATSDILVDYNGFSVAARAAFQKAVRIWERRIVSSQPIHVKANWKPLGSGILGSAGPREFYIHRDDLAYPVALTEAMCGCEPRGSHPVEIVANFNSAFSRWYLGTDGNPPARRYDFVTVVLHELGHGLGFLSSFGVSGSQGYWGFTDGVDLYPLRFDRHEYSGSGGAANRLIDRGEYPNPSAALKAELTDGTVFFGGPEVVAVNGGRARLWAPGAWDDGSSNSHLDENAFPPGTADALMTPFLHPREVIHEPGALTLALFRDIGWDTGPADGTPPTVGPPDVDIRAGVNAANSTRPVPARVSFTASDPSGIAATTLERKLGDGAWLDVPHSPPAATSVNVALPADDPQPQRLRAAARDGAGNSSDPTLGDRFEVRVFQDGDAAVSQTGAWTQHSNSGYLDGTLRHTSASGGGQALEVTGATDLAVVSALGPNRGKTRILVDGAVRARVNLYSPTLVKRRVVFATGFATPGDHSIEFRPTGTKASASSGTRADFDAFIAISEP
jgi:hypothetical protein